MKKGDIVVVWKDFDTAFLTRAKSDVFKSSSGSDVIFVEGISGYYAADRVRPVLVYDNVASELAEGIKVLD